MTSTGIDEKFMREALAEARAAAAVGEVRKKYFTGDVPPTSTVVVAPMAREQFMVEVAAIARITE